MGTMVGLVHTNSLETRHRCQEELMDYSKCHDYVTEESFFEHIYNHHWSTVPDWQKEHMLETQRKLAEEIADQRIAEEAAQGRLWAAEDAAENS